ncbi:MAG TPA: HAD hydrolase-like protein [Pyrinomonadaceae bacterium]|jgi:phosphoglycolate phosphatase-like HAD superfamily hydrolase|nr:HAD hydrolase-like protein [Pyrinomonadaceae bacterium]
MKSEDLRVILWDIDGTLVRTRRQGVFRDYTTPVLMRVFGTAGRLHELSVSGMTDMQIVLEALREEGFTAEQVRGRAAELTALYLEELERLTRGEEIYYALTGARRALEATERHPRYLNSLLTGNVEPAARWKLKLVGLDEFFRVPGAFGEDSHDRRDLPALARERISRHLRLDLKPEQLIVVGDTPNDIACARHFGARSVAVATGRTYSAEDLTAHRPDALLPDLADTALVLRTLAKL